MRPVGFDRAKEQVRDPHPEDRFESIGGELVVNYQVDRRGEYA